jgi:ATP-binding cassette, subfamily B, multidrug efflux pump
VTSVEQCIPSPTVVPSFSKRISFVWSYARVHARTLTFGMLSMVSREAVAFTIPLLIRAGVNTLTHPATNRHAWPIGMIGLAMVAVALPRSVLQTRARLNIIGTARDIEYTMRRDLLRHLFRLDSGFWSRTRTGDMMAYATNDLTAVRMMLGPGLTSLFESVVSLPVAIVVMGMVDWHLTALVLLPAPLAVLLLVRFGRIIRIRFDRIQEMFSAMSAEIQQMVAGARVLRSFVREEGEQRRFEKMNMAYLRANRILGGYSSSLDPLLIFITGLSVLVVLFYGGSQVLAHTLSVGSFVMFTTYVAMLVRPISALGRVINLMQRGMASIGRLQLLFSEEPSIRSGQGSLASTAAGKAAPAICFKDVSVSYGPLRALDSINLTIDAGSTIAILGETGAGKSTLARLLTRIIDPCSGGVLIDKSDARDLLLEDLRATIGCVPQETFLFSMTIAENIALGHPNATQDEIREAADLAGLTDDIATMRAGFETVVGERGIMLSGGQKQRIAIARAILKNPRILVLDDALSHVDSITEQRIIRHLKTIMAQRTTVLITHRVAAAMAADHIVVLERGRIIEHGTHESLLARAGSRYATLNCLQKLEYELEAI